MEAAHKSSGSMLGSIREALHYPVERAVAHYYPRPDHELDHFLRMVERHCERDAVVLELACGHFDRLAPLGRIYHRLIGLDVTPRIAENPGLDFKVRGDVYKLPLADGSVDLVISSYLMEHLEQPVAALREIARVLRPNGKFVFLTPNRRHYVCLVARLTPLGFHRWFLARNGRPVRDVHPTLYRVNTPRRLRELASQTGFRLAEMELFEPAPAYLGWSWPTFLLGTFYERLVNRFDILQGFRVSILGALEKIS